MSLIQRFRVFVQNPSVYELVEIQVVTPEPTRDYLGDQTKDKKLCLFTNANHSSDWSIFILGAPLGLFFV